MTAAAAVRRVRRFWFAALLLAGAPPAVGAWLAGALETALIVVLPALAWPLLRRWQPHWPLSGAALWLGSAALALAGIAGVAGGWLLVGSIGWLAAWDLDVLHGQMRSAHLEAADLLLRLHLQRLAWVALAGLLLGGLVLSVTLRLNFASMFVLALLALFALSALVRHLLDNLPPE